MKKIFFVFAFTLVTLLSSAQKIIWADDAEVLPSQNLMDWHHSKTQGPNAWTSGSQDLSNQLSTHTMKVLSSGQEGAPAPLRGSKSYQMKITWLGDNLGLQFSRNEWKYGTNCNDYTDTRWIQAAVYLPSGSFHGSDQAPTQILYDMKFGDSGGPASFSLWVQNGKYRVQQKANHGATEVQTELEGATGDVNYNVWVSWICERNFTDEQGGNPDGFIRLYKFIHGVDTEPVLVYEHSGPNYLMNCGSQSEAYYQMGLYKWNWITGNGNDNGGYPYSAESRGTWIMYMDNIKFWRSSATLADITADLTGGAAPSNQLPIANAGPNQTIVLPTDETDLEGDGSDDPDGTITAYAWTKVSGPTYTIDNAATVNPHISDLLEGTYVFRLTVTDDDGANDVDEVTIIVDDAAPTGSAPYATNSGNVPTAVPNYNVQLPTSTLDLTLYADVAGTDTWVQVMHVFKISGPTGGTVTENSQSEDNPTVFDVTLSALEEGTYVYRLYMEDNTGLNTANDTFNVVVTAEANTPPTVNAGADQRIPLDAFGAFLTKSTTLNATVSDDDGYTVQWITRAGPENSLFGSPSNVATTYSGLIGGIYTVRLIATDNLGLSSFDELFVKILSCNAGVDTTVQLPDPSITLRGTAIDPTNVTGVLWTKISGPASGTITSPTSLNTTLTGLEVGLYEFELTTTWTDISAKARVKVNVLNTSSLRIYKYVKP